MATRELDLAHREGERAESAQGLAGEASGRVQAARLRAAETHRRARDLHERIAALQLSFHVLQRRWAEPPSVDLLADPAEGDLRL